MISVYIHHGYGNNYFAGKKLLVNYLKTTR